MEINKTPHPSSFAKLIGLYFDTYEQAKIFLRKLPEEKFNSPFPGQPEETLHEYIRRPSLHIMGHIGQIVIPRKLIKNRGPSFVGGVSPNQRQKMTERWNNWWMNEREKFM